MAGIVFKELQEQKLGPQCDYVWPKKSSCLNGSCQIISIWSLSEFLLEELIRDHGWIVFHFVSVNQEIKIPGVQ